MKTTQQVLCGGTGYLEKCDGGPGGALGPVRRPSGGGGSYLEGLLSYLEENHSYNALIDRLCSLVTVRVAID